jgi:hypothetical protein
MGVGVGIAARVAANAAATCSAIAVAGADVSGVGVPAPPSACAITCAAIVAVASLEDSAVALMDGSGGGDSGPHAVRINARAKVNQQMLLRCAAIPILHYPIHTRRQLQITCH